MPSTPVYRFSHESTGIQAAVMRARAFLDDASYPLGTALIDHVAGNAPADQVIDALGAYQNPDGGFGRGLEVDIEAPVSNPFATRLAMSVLLALRNRPESELETRLGAWLGDNQNDDGDWHLSAETRAGNLAPWFAGWTHPNLNPACCLAGLAARLELGTSVLFERVAALFQSQASIERARTADFYTLLPYVEYMGGIAIPNRDAYLDAISQNITANASSIYADAGHFWEHVLAAGPDLVRRLPTPLLDRMAEQLLGEQSEDGGWPSPYSPAWRPHVTAASAITLLELSAGIG